MIVIAPTDSIQCDQPSPKLDDFKVELQLKLDQKLAHLQSECEKSVKLVRGESRKFAKSPGAEKRWAERHWIIMLFQWEDLTRVRNRIRRIWSEQFVPLLLTSIDRIWPEGSCEMIEIFQSDVARLLQNVKFVPYPQGDAYIGTIAAGRRDGWGVLDYFAENEWHAGEWKAGKEHGYGFTRHYNGGECVGNFVDGHVEGEAKFTAFDATLGHWQKTYEGEFRASKPHGYGTTKNCLGDVYEGNWSNLRPLILILMSETIRNSN